jgi:hypothetical protein
MYKKRIKLLINPRSLSFKFIVPNMEDSVGIQKVMGFSRGYHHSNSIRLGIKKKKDAIILYLYMYVKGEFMIKPLHKTFKVGDKLSCILEFKDNVMVANVDGYESWHYFERMCTLPIGYQLNPYAEKDGVENEQIELKIDIWDVKWNEK